MSFFRDVFKTAAPIAAGYFTGGATNPFMGMTGATAGMAAGALTGAGIAALSGDDVLMGGVSGGLGGYGGGGMGAAAQAAKSTAQGALTDAAANSLVKDRMLAQTGTGITSGLQGPTGQIGANMGQVNYGGGVNAVAGGGGSLSPTVGQNFAPNFKAINPPVAEASFGTDYGFKDVFTELGGGNITADGVANPNAMYKGAGKAGLTALPLVAAATQPKPEPGYDDNPMNKYDPTRTLNLSMDTGIDDALAKDSGLRLLAQGGYLNGGNVGDGMSDDISATIDGTQEAALSQGEFVVPADVVSHLGNGSSEAGSKQLYKMMDEVRRARTGNEKQGKEINPERYMPA